MLEKPKKPYIKPEMQSNQLYERNALGCGMNPFTAPTEFLDACNQNPSLS